ncbi:MAG: DUF3606 domain-containing protein [Sphingomonadaceae bacterium]|nr:DUF3606 domain-containing protein [Sphingomonadaceae bacterium]MBH1999219.1 DUF3606 domain-containing protein [Sphingomonadaceae bacterium]
MNADPAHRAPRDATRVSLEQEDGRYWTARFNATRDELEEAIDTVGDSVDAVAAYLNKPLG